MDEDWQSKKSLPESLFHIYETGLLADVAFLVGDEGERILAHKCVLASRSCVFERMFCGSLPESGDVSVPDITVPVFRDLMRFLYTDEVTIDASNVFPLLYAANKYSVERLDQKCVEFSKAGLTPENAFTFLQQGDIFDKQDLVNEAKKVILANPSTCIHNEGFQNLSVTWLQKFLRCENMDVKEIELFKAVVEWANAECKRQEKTTSATDLISVLKDVLPLVRFPLMSQQDFLVVVDSGMLTNQELVNLFVHSVDSTRSSGAFVPEKRNGTTMSVGDILIDQGPTPNGQIKEMLTITKHSKHLIELQAIKFSLVGSRSMTVKVNVSINGGNTSSKTCSVSKTRSEHRLAIPSGTVVNTDSTSFVITYDMSHETYIYDYDSYNDDYDSDYVCIHPPWHCNRHKYCVTPRADGKPQMLTVVHTDPDSGGVLESGLVCGIEYVASF